MTRTRQKSLVVILARELASNLATPLFVVDPEGRLVFYNEPAEGVLGTRFSETGELPASEWSSIFKPEDAEGNAIPLEELPLGIALTKRIPAHIPFSITGLDGVRRSLAVTAFPLFARADEFVGAVAIFWES